MDSSERNLLLQRLAEINRRLASLEVQFIWERAQFHLLREERDAIRRDLLTTERVPRVDAIESPRPVSAHLEITPQS